MLIKHVSIRKAEISFEEEGFEADYSIHFYFSFEPDRAWKDVFYRNLKKTYFKMKRINLIHNEIILLLTKKDDMQYFIDSVKDIIKVTNRIVEIQKKKTGLEAL